MRTSFDIPKELLDEARKMVGAKTKTQAIVIALAELIQRRKSRKILDLKGSLTKDFDHKILRQKR